MPSGKIHEVITIAITPIVATAAFTLTSDVHTAALAGTGCLAGVFLSPDLDLPQITLSERRALKIPIAGHLFVGLSFIYAAIFGMGPPSSPFRHRGVSHWPIIGTATRWLIFVAPPLVLAHVAGVNLADPRLLEIALPVFAGNCIADAVHAALDAID